MFFHPGPYICYWSLHKRNDFENITYRWGVRSFLSSLISLISGTFLCVNEGTNKNLSGIKSHQLQQVSGGATVHRTSRRALEWLLRVCVSVRNWNTVFIFFIFLDVIWLVVMILQHKILSIHALLVSSNTSGAHVQMMDEEWRVIWWEMKALITILNVNLKLQYYTSPFP